jgi:hypothetical protein
MTQEEMAQLQKELHGKFYRPDGYVPKLLWVMLAWDSPPHDQKVIIAQAFYRKGPGDLESWGTRYLVRRGDIQFFDLMGERQLVTTFVTMSKSRDSLGYLPPPKKLKTRKLSP